MNNDGPSVAMQLEGECDLCDAQPVTVLMVISVEDDSASGVALVCRKCVGEAFESVRAATSN